MERHVVKTTMRRKLLAMCMLAIFGGASAWWAGQVSQTETGAVVDAAAEEKRQHKASYDQAPLADAKPADFQSVGLAHVAFKIGEDLGKLREAKTRLDDAGIQSTAINHNVTKSLYFSDPDGNGVELYIDASDSWKEDSTRVVHVEPLEL
mgnify:CR=1 FL=1